MKFKSILSLYFLLSWALIGLVLGTSAYVEHGNTDEIRTVAEKDKSKNDGTIETYIYTSAFIIFILNLFMYGCFRLALCNMSNDVKDYIDYLIRHKSIFIYAIIGVIPPLIIFVSNILIYYISATYFDMGNQIHFVYALKYYNRNYINIIYSFLIPILVYIAYKFISSYSYEGFEYMKHTPANMEKFARLLKKYQDLVELAYDEDKAQKDRKLNFVNNIIRKIENLEGEKTSNELKFGNRVVSSNKKAQDKLNNLLINSNIINLNEILETCAKTKTNRTEFMQCVEADARNSNIEITGKMRDDIYKYYDLAREKDGVGFYKKSS